MKNKLRPLVIFLAVALAATAFAQSVNERLVRIQTEPSSGRVSAFFERVVTVEGTEYKQPWGEVSWGIASSKPVAITLADGTQTTTTRAAILQAVLAIAAEERAAQKAAAAGR